MSRIGVLLAVPILVGLLPACGGGSGGSGATPVLWGAWGKTGQPGNLYRIDPATGASTPIGPIGYAITGMAYAPDGYLYGTESTQGSASRLIRINPATGAGVVVGPLRTAALVEHPSIAGLTWAAGTLIGWSENGDDPVRVNPATGEVVVIGNSMNGSAGSGIAADANGDVFAATDDDGGDLWRVDLVTGLVTSVVVLQDLSGTYPNFGSIAALTFLQGALYGLHVEDLGDPLSGANLIRIDMATGAIIVIGPLPTGLDALASNLP